MENRIALSPDDFSPSLCRAARALVGWQQKDLADRAGVGHSTIGNFETDSDDRRLKRLTANAIMGAFAEGGAEFTAAGPGHGPGVRWKVRP